MADTPLHHTNPAPGLLPQALADPARLAAVQSLGLLDTPPEESFDRLTALACAILDAPIAMVTLQEAERQFFKSQQGLPAAMAEARQTPMAYSLCQHVVTSGAPLAIDDTRSHPLVCANLSVTRHGAAAYLGVPLTLATAEGLHTIGALCVLDIVPRQWQPQQVTIMQSLAAAVMAEITLRQEIARHAEKASQLRLLSGELAHRIKNIFAVTGSLLTLMARSQPQHSTFAEEVRSRLTALATAHAHIPVGNGSGGAGPLQPLLHSLLAAYPETQLDLTHLSVAEHVIVGPHTATAIALIVHELATNAVKHGALSTPEGRLNVTTTADAHALTLTWVEIVGPGAPAITAPPTRKGFGETMLVRTARGMGATFTQHWLPQGLTVTLALPLATLGH